MPMTQKELAEKSGLSIRQVQYYEQCRELPQSVKSLLQIAQALDLTIDDLLAPDIRKQ